MVSIVVAAVITAAIAAAPYALGILAGNAIGIFLATFTTALILGAASQALNKPPKAPQLGNFELAAQDRAVTLRQPVTNWRIPYGKIRIAGVITFMHTGGTNNEYLYMVLTLTGCEINSIGQMYFDAVAVNVDGSGDATTAPYVGYVHIEKNLGTSGQSAFAGLVSEVPGKWTSAHKQSGRAGVYVRLKFGQDVFPNGVPNITFDIEGRKVYDPRTTTTVYSQNAALCIADYLVNTEFGLGMNYSNEIDEDALIAAANVCDENVSLVPSGTEKRYTMNGLFETSESHRDVIQSMLTALAGRAIYIGGKWFLLAGAYLSPSITLDEDDLRGGYRILSRVSRRENFNGVKGIYVSEDNKWQPTDFPPVTNSTYVTEDNGEEKFKDIDLPWTTSSPTAQRLAKIELERARQQITLFFPAKFSAYRLQPLDTVNITLARMGWNSKPFEVTEAKLVFEGEPPALGVDLVLRETASSVYTWSAEETVVDPAPDTDLPNPFSVGTPTGLAAASGTNHLFVPGDGTVVSRIYVSWNPPLDAFAVEYELDYKRTSESNYNTQVIRNATNFYISPVEDGETYDIRVRSVSLGGVRSQYVTTQHVVIGKTEAPPNVTTFNVQRQADGTREFTWMLSQIPEDVRVGGGYKIRYNVGASFDWSTATDLHSGLLLASPFETNQLAAGQYVFGIKAIDSSGNESAAATEISATLGDPRLREVLLARLEESLGWPGSKTDCFVNWEGFLEAIAASGQDWSDLPATWSALADEWKAIVSSANPIVYETPEIDLGIDVTFTPLATMQGDGTPTFKMKTGTDSDGGVVGSWVDLSQCIGKRYFQLQMTVAGSAILVTSMILLLDGERLLDEFEDIILGSTSESWFELIATGHFKLENRKGMAAISSASIRAIQSVGEGGWTWELVSKSTTITGGSEPAAEFKVYNASGTLANATVDCELRGPKSN